MIQIIPYSLHFSPFFYYGLVSKSILTGLIFPTSANMEQPFQKFFRISSTPRNSKAFLLIL